LIFYRDKSDVLIYIKDYEERKSCGNRKNSIKNKSNKIKDSKVNADIVVTGNKLVPCEKLKIPHRTLYNYIVSNSVKPQEILATC